MGVAYEHGYGGMSLDADIAWAYYKRAAELGSSEAQMALAEAYADNQRPNEARHMRLCAYQQGDGQAAYRLGIEAELMKQSRESVEYYQQGVRLGDHDSAAELMLFFDVKFWSEQKKEDRDRLVELGLRADEERSSRYRVIADILDRNPDLRLPELDKILPLPPAELPPWHGIDPAVASVSKDIPTY